MSDSQDRKKIVIFGATGTIGKAVVAALSPQYDVFQVGHRQGAFQADLANADSVRNVFKAIGRVDAIISTAGAARFGPLERLTDEDFRYSLANKLMGQVNLARMGLEYLNAKGSITFTSGVLARKPMVGSAVISLVNAGLEGFARAAALEAPRGLRVNVVSPPWVTETLKALNMDPSPGKPAAEVARGKKAAKPSKFSPSEPKPQTPIWSGSGANFIKCMFLLGEKLRRVQAAKTAAQTSGITGCTG